MKSMISTDSSDHSGVACQVVVMRDEAMDRKRINVWMDRASSGDIAAFGLLSDAVHEELYRLALSLGLSREDAVEATQETLLRGYQRRESWRKGADAVGWLCGIAVNVCREHRRRESRKQSWMKEKAFDLAARGEAGGLDWDQETMGRLAEAMARLPERQREAIACRYLRRMSIRETAEAMGCAEGTVQSTVGAGLRQLQAVMERGHEKR